MNSLDLLGQSSTAQTWLTSVWILSLGVTIGFIVIMTLLLIGYVLAKVPGINSLFDNKASRYIAAAVMTVVGLAACYPLFSMANEYFSEVSKSDSGSTQLLIEVIISVALLLFICSLGLLALTSRRLMSEISSLFRDGPMFYFFVVCASFTTFCLVGVLLAFFNDLGVEVIEESEEQFESLVEYPQHIFPQRINTVVGKENGEGVVIDFGFHNDKIDEVIAVSDVDLRISHKPYDNDDLTRFGEGVVGNGEQQVVQTTLFGGDVIETLYVKNTDSSEGNLNLWIYTEPIIPEIKAAYLTAVFVIFVFLLYIFQRAAMPKISAIALSTFKTEVSQPLYPLILAVGCVLLIVFIYIPGNTFGEDIKILKDSGLKIILIFAIFMAVYAASKSVAEEIEGRTALTVLSKPVGRRQFILGKFFGIAWSVLLLYVVMGATFAICVAYKPIYDARETSREEIDWWLCHLEMWRIMPGLFLGYLEVLLFVAISIVISTRLPIMANLMICFAIYVLGHLTPLMVQSSVAVEAFEPVVFIGQLIAVILPVLDHFDIQAAVSGETEVPVRYLGWSFIYCTIYGTIALLVALIFFEDRDLA